MARKPRKSAGPGDNIRLTPNDYLSWRGSMRRAKIVLKEASAAVKAIEKRAKPLGVRMKSVKLVDQDSDVFHADLKEAQRYSIWERGTPLLAQTDFLDAITERPTDKARIEFTEEQAEDAGYLAGKDGMMREGNPHSAGSPLYARYDLGWLRGQAKIASEMEEGGTTTPADQTRKRREPPLELAPDEPPPLGFNTLDVRPGGGNGQTLPPWPDPA